MTVTPPLSDPASVPDACTLPAADQPLRVAEFDTLFRRVTDTERVRPTSLRLTLPDEPELAARVADLAARETGCCDFFRFTLTIRSHELQLTVETPTSHVDVLDAVAGRVDAARRR
jgi:hypothetical protein